MNTRRKLLHRTSELLCLAMLLMSSGCGDSEGAPKGRLLVQTKPDSTEIQRLRSMQKVLLVGKDGTQWDILPSSSEAELLWGAIRQACGSSQCNSTDTCGVCGVGVNLCYASAIEQMAVGERTTTLSITKPDSTNTEWAVAPQPTNTRVGFLRSAYRIFAEQANTVVMKLGRDCPAANMSTDTAARLGAYLVEAKQSLLRTAGEFSRAAASAADAQRRQGPSLQEDADRIFSGTELSRAEAAHILVGGPNGIAGTTRAMCRHAPLDNSAKRALAVLRDAGVAPQDVLALDEFQYLLNTQSRPFDNPNNYPTTPDRKISIDYLVNGEKKTDDSDLVGPTVAARLSHEVGHSVTDVAEELGIAMDAFVLARYALAEEVMLYGQHESTQRLAQAGMPDPPNCPLCPFAATRNGAAQIPKGFFANLLRMRTPIINSNPEDFTIDWESHWNALDDEMGGVVLTEQWLSPGRPYEWYVEKLNAARTLAGIRWFATRASTGSANGTSSAQFDQLRFNEPLRQALEPYVTTLLADPTLTGRLTMTLRNPATRMVNFSLEGFTLADNPTIVRGEEGLMCATSGAVWGAACNMAKAKIGETGEDFTFTGQQDSPSPGLAIFDHWIASSDITLPNRVERWYLVVPKDPSVAEPGPGEWKLVLGFVPDNYIDSTAASDDSYWLERQQWWPIAPSLENTAAELIETQPEECSLPSVSCSGVRFDERIALEDELSSDGSDVESSWKTSLQRATAAATESDRLADAYIQAGIGTDQWQASEEERRISREQLALGQFDKVQAICGTSVSPQVLLSLLENDSGQVDLRKLSSGTCTASTPESTCVAGTALTSWAYAFAHSTDGDGKSLADCISDMLDTVPLVALGDKRPCAWQANGTICGGATETMPCPVLPGDNGGCSDVARPSGAQLLDSSDASDDISVLSLLNTASQFAPSSTVCQNIRKARTNPTSVPLAKLQSPSFSLPGLSALRAQLTETAEIGSYVTVQASNGLKFTTGNNVTGYEGETWPCGVLKSFPKDCDPQNANTNTLRCDFANCGDMAARGVWNARLDRAFAIAQAITWRSGDSLIQHWVPRPAATGGARSTEYLSPNFASSSLASEPAQIDVWDQGSYVYAGRELVPFRCKTYANFPTSSTAGWETFSPFIWDAHDYSSNTTLGICGVYAATPSQKDVEWVDPIPFYDFFNDTTIATDIWNGMATGESGEGYLVNALTKEGRNAPIPGGRRTVMFSDEAIPLNYDSILDALELLCSVGEDDNSSSGECVSSEPPTVVSASELPALTMYLQCMGNEVLNRARAASFANFPKALLDPMRKTTTGTYVTEPGELGQAYSDVRNAAIEVATSGPIISGAIKGIAEEVKTLHEYIKQYGYQDEIANIQFEQQSTSAIAACAGGLMNTIASLGKEAGSAMASCGNLASVLQFGDKIRVLTQKIDATQKEIAISNFRTAVNNAVTTLRSEELKLLQALETLRARLGKVESLKQEVVQHLQSAVWHMSNQSATAAEVTTVLGRHQALAQERYVRAHDNAVRLAFLAKRAIEQRLGMSLTNITEDMPLVDAPARWESSICASSPIDYSALKARDSSIASFADAFVGDYVKKLENVVESYRLKYSFHEGDDTVVASLRDDIFGVRTTCSTKSRNLLTNASRIDQATAVADASTDQSGWLLMNCLTGASTDPDGGISTRVLGDCEATTNEQTTVGGVPFYTLNFNKGGQCSGVDCGWQESALLGQKVKLDAGKYVFSWYAVNGHLHNGRVQLLDGTSVPTLVDEKLDGDTPRWSLTFDVTEPATYVVGFGRPHFAENSWAASVAAPMLERIDRAAFGGGKATPGVFQDSDASGNTVSQICAEEDGEVFRSTRWRRACDVLCKDGFQEQCATTGQQYCYWETSFHFRQKDIEDGTVFRQSGFARGNFNYRIQSLGLNFVGTGLQACDGSSQACYGSGFVPYTIIHEGPYYVRNHLGEDFEAKLFTGRIEHARGLGAERYITNPISSTDMSLIESYMRPEFSGRPLDGTFIVRVWDENNIKFDAIKDVQLVMKYRYWTRFQ